MAALPELLASLDTNSQIRGHQFERICKWYLQNDPKYSLELKKVWLWDEWPGRWGPDAGIDLVAETYNGKVWAIQAKAYTSNHSITKGDIDTFLSESSRRIFSYRLLIATTNYIGSTAERTLRDQEKPIGRVLLSGLEKSDVEWPESPDELMVEPRKPKKPQPHQRRAIDDVRNGFARYNRGQLIMASGTGKTLVSLWIAEELNSHRTLILMPSLTLLAQTLRAWTSNTSQRFHYLPVCSDDTVRGGDRLISRTSELSYPVTTEPQELAAFLLQTGPLVVFATYQSSPAIGQAFKQNDIPAFDLAIADEAHRCAGSVSSPFAIILDAETIRARRRLFMTATPRYFTDRTRREAEELEFEIASMDDEVKFGPVLHKLSYAEAIRQELLSDYQVAIVGIDDPTYRAYSEQGMAVTIDGEDAVDARILASQIALAKAMRKYDLRRVISFHSRIKRAKEFSDRLPGVIRWMPEDARPSGNVWSRHVHGEMPTGQRDNMLKHLRELEDEERGLIANARCLGEGVDVPALDGVAFIDPRHSQLDIIQAVGRAIRKAPNKEIGTIVLPVFVDPDQDCEAALDSSVFKPIWDVLKAIRAHDEVLGDTLDRLRQQLGRHGAERGIQLPERIIIDLPITVGEAFVESLHIKIVKQSTASWNHYLGLLERYISQTGHARVPVNYVTEEGYNLGQWVQTQRRTNRKGELPSRRHEVLEQLPLWTWDYREAAWEVGLEHLRGYILLKGHADVPFGYITATRFNLGAWVRNQRIAYQRGKLSSDKQRLLEAMVGWVWQSKRDEKTKFHNALAHLQGYVAREGHAAVPPRYVCEDGYQLGAWVGRLRRRYRKQKLSPEQTQMLEQMPGWTCHDPRAEWRDGIERLREYVRREGHANVPDGYVTSDGYNLGQWVAVQRSAYREGKLSARRQKTLERLAGWLWDPLWLSGFERLRAYAKSKGHTSVPENYLTNDGLLLGRWVNKQRWAYLGVGGRLLPKQKQMLEQLAGWTWNPYGARWQEGFMHLLEYVYKEHDPHVPEKSITEDGYHLGKWVQKQKQAYFENRLSLDQRQLLEELFGWTSEPRDWLGYLELLQEYAKRLGHTYVPTDYETRDGHKLGRWVAAQRSAYRRGKLSLGRQGLLEQLPGWVWDHSEAKWKAGFKYLREYIEQTGHRDVGETYVTEDGYRLGSWVRYQRQLHRRGKLPAERQKALEQLSDWRWTL